MKRLLISLVRFYQKYLSPDQGIFSFFVRQPACVFYPTCSNYFILAIEKHGIIKGFWLFLKRIARCHPGASPKVDHVPGDIAK